MDNQERFLQQKAKGWMARNHRNYDTPDEMVFDCVYHFDDEMTYECWLDNLDHWVWDLADDIFRANKREISPGDEEIPEDDPEDRFVFLHTQS